jgi:cytochrome c peroxidase
MLHRFIIYSFSLGLLTAAMHCPAMASGETHKEVQEALMRWEDALLMARIFLGCLPAEMPGSRSDTPERIALGRKLFFERGISLRKTQACHDCHFLTDGRAGADTTATSKGDTGLLGKRNTPTVINAGFQTAQFWDGRAPDLAVQAKGPILNPVEMAIRTPEEVVERISNIEGYPEAFRRAFPDDKVPLTYDNVAEAISAFERTLIAPSRFDRLMNGDQKAFNVQERRGLIKFMQYNCVECHTSATVGGRFLRPLGQRNAYSNSDDTGRYDITKKDEDLNVFKVPMLRNVTRTAPYFHDGQVADLREAVRLMAYLQLDCHLTSRDLDDLVSFLGTLEGNPPPVHEPGEWAKGTN